MKFIPLLSPDRIYFDSQYFTVKGSNNKFKDYLTGMSLASPFGLLFEYFPITPEKWDLLFDTSIFFTQDIIEEMHATDRRLKQCSITAVYLYDQLKRINDHCINLPELSALYPSDRSVYDSLGWQQHATLFCKIVLRGKIDWINRPLMEHNKLKLCRTIRQFFADAVTYCNSELMYWYPMNEAVLFDCKTTNSSISFRFTSAEMNSFLRCAAELEELLREISRHFTKPKADSRVVRVHKRTR